MPHDTRRHDTQISFVGRSKTQNALDPEHVDRIVTAYRTRAEEAPF